MKNKRSLSHSQNDRQTLAVFVIIYGSSRISVTVLRNLHAEFSMVFKHYLKLLQNLKDLLASLIHAVKPLWVFLENFT